MNQASDTGFVRLASPFGSVSVDPAVGNLRALHFVVESRTLEPLHTAPWLDEPEDNLPADLVPIERNLSGDFLCAPFGATDDPDVPLHGWSANSAWSLVASQPASARFSLDRTIQGARIEKTATLAADAPLLYQVHAISGGSGGLTAAHHPMMRMAAGGRLFMAPKRVAITPDAPPEPGRDRLAYPGRSTDLSAFPAADGGTVDLTRLPIGDAHEDFVALVEADHDGIGWTALIRDAEDDIVFILKEKAALPITMLWHSNAGRDYAPWNGRHKGVIGIEDGRAAGVAGLLAARRENPLNAEGAETVFELADNVTHTIRHVIGCLPRAGWTRIDDIAVDGATLVLTGENGATRKLPFDAAFFEGED